MRREEEKKSHDVIRSVIFYHSEHTCSMDVVVDGTTTVGDGSTETST